MIFDGIINVNKPQNMTSHDVVSVVRRTLGLKRVGHTGTLDPMATGVLPICVGKATRIIEYLDLDLKTYLCTMSLGMETDTQDIWGKTVETYSTSAITEEEIRDAFKPFKGVIEQKPPMYSAIKVNGKKLYEYARSGETVEVKTRKIYINDLEIKDIAINGTEQPQITFKVQCSKGTYIRTICQDVGKILGCGGTLCSLQRCESGIFTLEKSIELEKLKNLSEMQIQELLYDADAPLIHFGKVVTDETTALLFANGWHLPLEKCKIIKRPQYEKCDFYLPIREEYRHCYNVYGIIKGKETFIGVAFYNEKYRKLVADKIFYMRESDKNENI